MPGMTSPTIVAAPAVAAPAMPAIAATPTKSVIPGVSAPVPSRSMPTKRVPAVIITAPNELDLLNWRRRPGGGLADLAKIHRGLGGRGKGQAGGKNNY